MHCSHLRLFTAVEKKDQATGRAGTENNEKMITGICITGTLRQWIKPEISANYLQFSSACKGTPYVGGGRDPQIVEKGDVVVVLPTPWVLF